MPGLICHRLEFKSSIVLNSMSKATQPSPPPSQPPCKRKRQDSHGFWISRCGVQIPGTKFQSLSVKLRFWIPIVSGILDSLSNISNYKAQDCGFHKQKNSRIPEFGFPNTGRQTTLLVTSYQFRFLIQFSKTSDLGAGVAINFLELRTVFQIHPNPSPKLTTQENTITYHNALCLSPTPTKFCLSIIFSFSWKLKWPQEKTMPMENLGWGGGDKQRALWYVMVLEWSIAFSRMTWLNFRFFFFYQTVFLRGGTGENGFRERRKGKHSINQVKLSGVPLTMIRCLLTFCFFALFFNFTLFFIHLLAVFSPTHAHEPQPQLAQDSGIHTFVDATYNIKELQCSREDTLQSLKSKNKTL